MPDNDKQFLTAQPPNLCAYQDVLYPPSLRWIPDPSNPFFEGGSRCAGLYRTGNFFSGKDGSGVLPLITVITVVYNGRHHIEKTIQSVLGQKNVNIEYLIIDGGSSDGTLDIIRKYDSGIDYWMSQRDAGIYDAMNRGASLATGQYLFFLNSDDVFFRFNTVFDALKSITSDECRSDLYYGDAAYDRGDIFRSSLGLKTYFINTIHHQAAFYRRNLFFSFRYRTDLMIASDYELNFLINREKFPSKKLGQTISLCTADGVSQSSAVFLVDRENNMTRRLHMNAVLCAIAYFVSCTNTAIKLSRRWIRLMFARQLA